MREPKARPFASVRRRAVWVQTLAPCRVRYVRARKELPAPPPPLLAATSLNALAGLFFLLGTRARTKTTLESKFGSLRLLSPAAGKFFDGEEKFSAC